MQDITIEASTCISRLVGMCEVATARAEVAEKERDQFSQQVKMVEAENKRLREALTYYANDEDRYLRGDGEPYGSIPTEVGFIARQAREAQKANEVIGR